MNQPNPQPRRKPASLSANQLMAVELALFLLSEVAPRSPFTVLPELLTTPPPVDADPPVYTAKQLRYLRRAQLLLGQFRDAKTWEAQLDRYAGLPENLQAYQLDMKSNLFALRREGFSRNRVFTLKRLFD